MYRPYRLVAGLCLLSACPVFADVLFGVSVDTSTISGTIGFLDFQFNPGPLGSQSAFADILNFSGGTLMGPPAITGDVTGALPGIVSLNNDTLFNDYFQQFKFGPAITFGLLLGGPALNNPGGFASGSTFGFGMFDATGTQPLLTSDPNGFTFTIDVNLDGTTTVLNSSTGNPQVAHITPEPEPAPLVLLFTVLAMLGVVAALRKAPQRS